jgi:hypothetical protein
MSRGHKIIQNFLKKRGAWDNNPFKDAKPKEKEMEPKKIKEANVKIKQPGYNPVPQETIMNKEAEPGVARAAGLVDLSGMIKKDKKTVTKEETSKTLKAKNYAPNVPAEQRKDSLALDAVKAATNNTLDGSGTEHNPKRTTSGAADTIRQNDSSRNIQKLMADLGIRNEAVVNSYVGKNALKATKEVPTPAVRAKTISGYTGKNVAPPFDPDKNPKKVAVAGKSGYGPSAARHLARLGLSQMTKLNPKIGESWSNAVLDQLAEVHPSIMAMAKVAGKQSLKAKADRHTEMALAANKAGDDAKVKYHQAQVAKIKAQMQEEAELNELKASTLQSYADKAHQQALDATYDAAHLNRSGEEQLKANAKRIAAKRAGGVQRAQTKLDKMKEELEDQKPMTFAHHAGDVVTCKKTGRLASVQAVENDQYTVVYADGSTETGPADWWTGTDTISEGRVVEQPRGWNVRHLKPAGHGIVGKKVRSYDFPGLHDSHYIEGHVTDEDPHSYHIRTTKVVRHNKEEPIPAHLMHVRAPKGLSLFGGAQGVYYAPREHQLAPRVKKTMSGLRGKK